MGKQARARARRRQSGRLQAPDRALGDPGALFEKQNGDADASLRLLQADDTAAEPLRALLETDNFEVLVALIEPVRNGFIQRGDNSYDIRIAIATKMGLPLAGPIGPRPVAGWTFGPRQGGWDLTDPTGTLIARGKVATEDSARESTWTAQAIATGQILVAYGMRVGVRVPEGESASSYDERYRAAELHKSLIGRRACAAMVRLPQQIDAFRSVPVR